MAVNKFEPSLFPQLPKALDPQQLKTIDNRLDHNVGAITQDVFHQSLPLENSKNKKESQVKLQPEEDPYDLDVQIRDLASTTLPSDTAQSQWSRCSCHCQTERGHTCGGCDTQQQMWSCYGC